MSKDIITTKVEIDAYVSLINVRKEVRNIRRKALSDPKNKDKYSTHIAIIYDTRDVASIHCLLMEESIPEITEYLDKHGDVGGYSICPIGKAEIHHDKKNR